mgnify:CR=1 FL=1
MMKWIDPRIELAACGSSGRNMPTFGAWEDTVLEHTFDHVEYISLHTYHQQLRRRHARRFLASVRPDGQFHRGGGGDRRRGGRAPTLVQAHHAELRRMERLVPHAAQPQGARVKPGWPVAPADPRRDLQRWRMRWPSAACCISLLNHADRVKAACLAQLVNVIAPIMTETGGAAWRQNDLPSVRADEPLSAAAGCCAPRWTRTTYAANLLRPAWRD